MREPLKPKFADFVCVICRRLKSMQYEHKLSRTTPIPPICFGCETEYAPMNRQCGSFMDRRKARQIGALAEALRCEAAYTEWPAHWKMSPTEFEEWKAAHASP